MQKQEIYANAIPCIGGDSPQQSDVQKIQAQFEAAESLYARVVDLARQLVGEVELNASNAPQPKNGGTLGDLAYRAEYLSGFAAKANEEINRIYRATYL